jgi:hypothetical protein
MNQPQRPLTHNLKKESGHSRQKAVYTSTVSLKPTHSRIASAAATHSTKSASRLAEIKRRTQMNSSAISLLEGKKSVHQFKLNSTFDFKLQQSSSNHQTIDESSLNAQTCSAATSVVKNNHQNSSTLGTTKVKSIT